MNDSVKAMQKLEMRGNVIPHQWFNTIKKDSGSVDYLSIIILSEIVYWYRPTQVFDEQGRVKGIKQKFAGDALQKSYDDLAEKLGATKRQVRESVIRLEKLGLITREFRNLVVRGTHLSNVLFIHLNVDELERVTFISQTYDNSKSDLWQKTVTPMTENGQTYTKITTDITTKNTTDINTLVSTNVDDAKVEKSKYKYSDEDMVLSKLLFQYIRNLDAKAKEPNFEYWANTVRLMREVDKRSYEEIKEVIIWCQNDDFWQGNILSTTKLRKQFSKLLIRMNKERGAASGQQSWQQAPRSANQDKVARESKNSGFYWEV